MPATDYTEQNNTILHLKLRQRSCLRAVNSIELFPIDSIFKVGNSIRGKKWKMYLTSLKKEDL